MLFLRGYYWTKSTVRNIFLAAAAQAPGVLNFFNVSCFEETEKQLFLKDNTDSDPSCRSSWITWKWAYIFKHRFETSNLLSNTAQMSRIKILKF